MKRRHLLLALLGMGALWGCTPSQVYRGARTVIRLDKGDITGAVTSNLPLNGLPGNVRLVFRQILKVVIKQWGDKKLPRRKEVVKYTDHYQSRALINFSNGTIVVETQRDRAALKKAIVQTLLAPDDPAQFDLFSSKPPPLNRTPFLYELVLDQHGKPIKSRWRANRYADWLIAHCLRVQQIKGKRRLQVRFAMVDNLPGVQQHKYAAYVLRHSRRYRLDPALVWAIIHVESHFNPYAVSPIPAYGLMQVVPRTAGRDAYRYLHKRDGMPSRTTLFTARHNIEYGCTYLHLLNSRYLRDIKHPKSREYCIIAAYNTGAGNVLRAFSASRKAAVAKINSMRPDAVYNHLRHHLRYAEARRYLAKVVAAKGRYRHRG